MLVPKLHIGIDLDNTIICYDEAFHKVAVQNSFIPKQVGSTKREVKKYLTALGGGQHRWEKLQGMVYGKQISQASLFHGVLEFIDAVCAHPINRVSIVSHKTKIAHHDPDQTNLRVSALQFLQKHKLIAPDRLNIGQVYFCDTLDEKVRKIAHLGCQIFIDDLVKVFEHREFSPRCKPILFRGNSSSFQCCSSWKHIHHVVLT